MRDKPLPVELSAKFGRLPDLVYRGGDEWSSACPQCGGADISRRDRSDRFRLFAASSQHGSRVWCRNCNHFEWANEGGEKPDETRLEAARIERLRLADQERQRIRNKIVSLQKAAYWRGWHAAMDQRHRELWYREGIPDWAIDTYKLGFCADHTCYHLGEEYHTPTMTIPHWGPGWELLNIQHRLLEPPAPGDKYRQMSGLPAVMFLTEPDEKLMGPALVVEGAKKAIVTYLHVGHREMVIIGLPSKTPSSQMLDQLSDCEPVYIALDPDAYIPQVNKHGLEIAPNANRVASKLGDRARIVQLPVKPDDFFTIYRGRAEELMEFVRQAARV